MIKKIFLAILLLLVPFFAFAMNEVEDSMYVTGNLGVGSTAPVYKLDVAGTMNATALWENGAPFVGSQWSDVGNDIYYTTGNVGVGSSVPRYALDVVGTVNASALYVNGSPYIGSQWTTYANVGIGTTSGNVGIGSSVPRALLDVAGAGYFNNVYSSGNVGIGTVTATDSLTIHTNSSGATINCIPPGQGGNDASTVTLLHFDNNFTDSSATANTFSSTGTVVTTSDQSEFGGYSANFTGVTRKIVFNTNSAFTWGTGDFTIDFWSRITSEGYYTWYSQATTAGIYFQYSSGEWYFSFNDGDVFSVSALSIANSNWHHIALVRSSGTVRLFVDGVARGSGWTTFTGNVTANTAQIGTRGDGGGPLTGQLDEFRITKGLARWTTNFTPPTRAYDALSSVATPAVTLKSNSTQSGKIWTDGDASNNFKIDVPSTTRMTIDVNGNVGIGTTVPRQLLEVNGSMLVNTNVGIGSSVPAQKLDVVGNIAGTGNLSISTVSASSHIITTGGNVGIGTSVPRQKLEIVGSAITSGNVGIGTSTITNALTVNGGVSIGNAYLATVAPTDGMIIQGNVGIGTAVPATSLHVAAPSGTFTPASGGTTADYYSGGKLYRVHTLTASSGNFTAPSPATTLRVLAIGGGGNTNCTPTFGYGGGGGEVIENASYASTAAQVIAYTVGGSSTQSTFGSITARGASGATSGNGHTGGGSGTDCGCGGGGDSQNAGCGCVNNGTVGGQGTSSTITGTSVCYGGGGGGGSYWCNAVPGYCGGGTAPGQRTSCGNGIAPTSGSGGGGAASGNCSGASGSVLVSYEVPTAADVLFTGGKVGVNTTSTTSILTVRGYGSVAGTNALQILQSNANPTVTVQDDGNVGIGTTSIPSLLTIGVNRFNVLSAGNVGIGSSAPRQKLEIVGSAITSGNVGIGTSTITNALTVNGGSSFGNGYLATVAPANGVLIQGNVGIGSTSPRALLDVGGTTWMTALNVTTGNVGIGTTAPTSRIETIGVGTTLSTNNLSLRNSAGTSLMVVNDGGNVGIGTTGPTQKLSVIGGAIGYAAYIKNAAGSGVQSGLIIKAGSSTSDYALTINNAADSLSLFAVRGDGNLGIGTTGPNANLHLYTGIGQLTAALTDAGVRTGNFAFDVNSGTAGAGGAITFGNVQSVAAGSVGWAAIKGLLMNGGGNTTGDLAFSTRNAVGDIALTERMRILSTGNVGIGTTGPTGLLHIAAAHGAGADIWMGFENTSGGGYGDWTIGKVGNNDLTFFSNTGGLATTNPRVTFDYDGNVGIGTTAPGAGLQVGGGTISGTTSTTSAHVQGNLEVDGSIYAEAGTAGQALCIAADKRLGQCTSVVGIGGDCTCAAY